MPGTQRIILPMAGHGKRFVQAGYKVDKPLIEVNGKTLLEWSLDCIPRNWMRIGILRDDQQNDEIEEIFLQKYGQVLVPRLLYLPGTTRGAAMTVLTAALALPPDSPVAVMNCDQWFACDLWTVTNRAMAEGWDGYILTFGEGKPWQGPSWSYAVTDGDSDRVVKVVEKPIENVSEHATVGFYWFRRASDLVESICSMIAFHWTVNGEYYLAPCYNVLLGWRSPGTGFEPRLDTCMGTADIRIVPVQEFVGLGTPEQVRSFELAAMVHEP